MAAAAVPNMLCCGRLGEHQPAFGHSLGTAADACKRLGGGGTGSHLLATSFPHATPAAHGQAWIRRVLHAKRPTTPSVTAPPRSALRRQQSVSQPQPAAAAFRRAEIATRPEAQPPAPGLRTCTDAQHCGLGQSRLAPCRVVAWARHAIWNQARAALPRQTGTQCRRRWYCWYCE